MANEQISEITTVPTNATVIKIINALIKRYNSLGSIYTFKGSVQTYDDLLAIQNPQIGDVYNVIQEDEEHQIAAGSNFVWDGTVWDNLGGSLAGLVQSVNGINPDSLGQVTVPLLKALSTTEGKLIFTKNDDTTTQVDNIKKLYMSTLGENINLNDLTEPGIYICGSNVYTANYENCPIQKAFLLEVQAANSGYFVYQFLTQYNDGTSEAGNQYVRTYQVIRGWSAWTQIAKQSDLTNLSNNINRKSYNSLASLGLSYQTVTFADIINALPVNSTLTFYVDVVTSEPSYAPNLQIPASGLVIVVKGASNTIPTLFYLTPIVKGYTSYTGQYTTYNDYGFSGWQPMVLSVNAIKPNINGNVTIDIPKPVIASEAEAEAGTNNTKFMTPLRVKQAIDALAANNGGIVSANLAQNGYVKFANGLILQWGYGNSESTQTFPIKFTNSVIGIYGSKRAINYEYTFAATSITNTNFFMSTRNSEGNSRVIACNWLVIGQ